MKFHQNCVHPKDLDELAFIEENMREISGKTFFRHVPFSEVNNSLLYGIRYKTKENIINDWSVKFYRCTQKSAYILVNSATTYIFK